MITLAVDAMGGDLAPTLAISGVCRFLKSFSCNILLFVQKDSLPLEGSLPSSVTIMPCDLSITNFAKPSTVLRSSKKTSMGLAIHAVRNNQAQAVISAGNTGAFMALCKTILKPLKDIERPAIPAVLPTLKGKVLVLDLGANLECSAKQLVQFALMGEALASHLFDIPHPTIGLLNVGSEEIKGGATLQEAVRLLKTIDGLRFHGFVEGNDIAKGTTDVVVTDGFSGNIALKSIEGTAQLLQTILKESLSSSLLGRIGGMLARSSFKAFKKKTDPRLYNGAMFLGVQGIAIKSHGGTDEIGFAHAMHVAVQMVQRDIIASLSSRLSLGSF